MPRPNTPNGRVTATDIARHLGLSVTAVSFVLNDSPHINKVSPRNRERIRALAREWNYIPNLVAKSLREQRANVIGVSFADLRFGWAHAALLGMLEVLEPAGTVPLIAISMWDVKREQQDLRSMLGRQVDGIILTTPNVENLDTYNAITASGVPLVFMGDALSDHDEFSRVLWDEADAIAAATEHLITSGHDRLVMLSSDYDSLTQEMRH
ncbi:MAG: LacI family DNA-binding transcriptional regulator, partial [Planctomycetota bacterium]